MKNKAITSRNENFAEWYTDVVRSAKLCDYSGVKGFFVLEPNGYALWEKIQNVLDSKFKATGVQNVSMPLLIPESLFAKEKELISGFAPEGACVTEAGGKKLEEKLFIRPTSETLFCDYYASHVKSHRDLPKRFNQWCSVVRWEKETRPFLRSREFLWQEGHTIHSTKKEAEEEVVLRWKQYIDLFENYLAIPVYSGRKTENEKFAGAEYTLTLEAMMHNGIALQSATSHYLGQNFSKAYEMSFMSREEKEEFCYQTSWGASTRIIAAIIMVHGDDNGLILPPKIAPRQVVVVPIGTSERVISVSQDVCKKLSNAGITSFVDLSEKSPGFKFAEHEVNGIPVRIEVGERDLDSGILTIARRDTREKFSISIDSDIVLEVTNLMESIQSNLFDRAKENLLKKTTICRSMQEIENKMSKDPGFVKAMWCGDEQCEKAIKEIHGTKSRCILNEEPVDDKCVCCGKKAKHLVVWGIQY